MHSMELLRSQNRKPAAWVCKPLEDSCLLLPQWSVMQGLSLNSWQRNPDSSLQGPQISPSQSAPSLTFHLMGHDPSAVCPNQYYLTFSYGTLRRRLNRPSAEGLGPQDRQSHCLHTPVTLCGTEVGKFYLDATYGTVSPGSWTGQVTVTTLCCGACCSLSLEHLPPLCKNK